MAKPKKKDSTPIVETNAMGLTITSYSQYQNKLLLKMIAYSQRDIREAITQQVNDKTHVPAFTAEENLSGYRTIRIPLSKLEHRQGHRERTKEALAGMLDKPIYIPFLKPNGNIDYAGFKHPLSISIEKKANQNIVVITIPVLILKYYLSTDLGYHYLDLQQMAIFTHNCTRQMYRAYKSYFALKHNKKSFPALRLAATLSPKNNFHNKSTIEKEVLKIAKKEMDILYQHNLCNIHFDYQFDVTEEKFTEKVKQYVVLTFYDREDEVLSSDRQAELDTYQAKTKFILKHTFGVNEKTAIDLACQVKIWMLSQLDVLIRHKTWFAKKMEEKKNDKFNKAGYIVNAMKKFFRETNQKKDASDGKKGDGTPTATPIDQEGQFLMHKNE